MAGTGRYAKIWGEPVKELFEHPKYWILLPKWTPNSAQIQSGPLPGCRAPGKSEVASHDTRMRVLTRFLWAESYRLIPRIRGRDAAPLVDAFESSQFGCIESHPWGRITQAQPA